MFPALFVSHGSPTLPFDDVPARDFLRALGPSLPRPKAIVTVSAHWQSDEPAVTALVKNATIHDFFGFPEPLYDLRYDAPGSPATADRIAQALQQSGFPAPIRAGRGLDHGAWVPLLLMFPEADIPVLQLSIQMHRGVRHHIALGKALAPLRDEVLILGSGGMVHNLQALDWNGGPEPDWSMEFADWMHQALVDRRDDDLVEYRIRAPHAARAHPSEDHILPLFVACGAGRSARRLHQSVTFGSLRMDAYAFD